MTDDDTLLYRLIASYQNTGSFQDFANSEQITVAPSITLNLGDRTSLNLYYEYNYLSENPRESFSPILSDADLLPRSLFVAYPDLQLIESTSHRYSYILRHEFNDSWQIRNNFSVATTRNIQNDVNPTNVIDDRFIEFEAYDGSYTKDNYFGQIDLLGEFNTGPISHQLLIGFDYNRFVDETSEVFLAIPPRLDVSDPDYDISDPDFNSIFAGNSIINQSYGAYIQDQIAFSDNLKLLLGGRYDWVSYRNELFRDGIDQSFQSDGAFSPRIGLVYQPSDTISLYASYSQSFRQSTGFNTDGRSFEPTRGTQYEVGVKADFLEGRLSSTLAAYHLTKTNVTTPDPDNPRFSIQTGEQRSQGVELDVTGEVLPGWNVILSYAYTDAEVTKDNAIPEGNQLQGVPENQASLWTTYIIQEGALEGLGIGLGLFYVGAREGDLANSFQLDDYLRTDAAVYYRRGRFNAAINVRNLFNIDYVVNSQGSRNFSVRGEPITVVGSVSWDF